MNSTPRVNSAYKTEMLQRLHSLAGVLPLGAYLLFHLWENWPVVEGRQAWMERMIVVETQVRTIILFFISVSLALHILLAFRITQFAAHPLLGSTLLRHLQRITGVLVFVFIGYHVYKVDSSAMRTEVIFQNQYDVMLTSLGQPTELFIYIIGVSCACFHFAHGITRATVSWGVITTQRALTSIRYVAGTFGFILWGMIVHVIGYFSVGHGFFG